jgi:hypothetical protein
VQLPVDDELDMRKRSLRVASITNPTGPVPTVAATFGLGPAAAAESDARRVVSLVQSRLIVKEGAVAEAGAAISKAVNKVPTNNAVAHAAPILFTSTSPSILLSLVREFFGFSNCNHAVSNDCRPFGFSLKLEKQWIGRRPTKTRHLTQHIDTLSAWVGDKGQGHLAQVSQITTRLF